MQIKILCFSGCPNWETAVTRVRTVLAELGRADIVVRAEDVHQMAHLPAEWAGSPTVLVDGLDPFAAGDVVTARDVCRVYATEAGFDGAPSIDQLRRAMSPTETEATVQDLARAIAAATIAVDETGRRIGVAVYDLLAQGDPVTTADIARHAGEPEAIVVATLKGWPGVFWDDEGRVVGFWGLAIPEMDHRFHAEKGKPMYAWCALDPFLIVPVIRRPARVESNDPITGEPITMTVTPQGIKDLAAATAVVSFLAPNRPFDFDVIESFCHYVLNFASRQSAERWAAEREGIVLLPAAEAFEVGLRAWSKWRSPMNTKGRATAK